MSRCVSVVIQKYNVKTLTTKRPTGMSEGRAMHGAIVETVEMQRIVRNNPSDHQATDRDVGRYDSRDGEGRVAPGAATENNARLHGWRR